jgi:uncharacterized protein with LGFP repeats
VRIRSVALLSLLTPVALVAPMSAGTPDPRPVEAEVFTVDVAGVDPGALAELEVAGGDEPELLTGELETREFTTVGLSWERDSALTDVSVEVRTRSEGVWSDWEPINAHEVDGPDMVLTDAPPATEAPGAEVVAPVETTPEGDASRTMIEREATVPLWAGPSDAVQVRMETGGVQPRGARLELVDPGESPADRLVGQPAPGTAEAAARPAIVSRAQWGADERIRRGSASYSPTLRAGFIHHTVNSNSYTQAQAPALMRSIYAYHVKSNGWSDVGYNFLVDRFGTVYEGRFGGVDRPVVGAHAAGFNANTFGISIIGDFTSTAPTAASVAAVERVMAWKLRLHGVSPSGTTTLTSAGGGTSRYARGAVVSFRTISGHRDGNSTACPGARLYELLPAIRNRAAGLAGGAAPAPAPAPTTGATTYTVRAGDTLHRIATAHGVTVDQLRAANNLTGDYIAVGQVLNIPGKGSASTPAPLGAIAQHHLRHGGNGGFLGAPTSGELPTRDGVGRFTTFQRGAIYWHPTTGARELHGDIRSRWNALSWEFGPLGYPTTDELPAPDGRGRFNVFQRGSIYWSPTTGARDVYGAIRTRWSALGWEGGTLGYPTTGETGTPDRVGRFNHFQRGSVYWTPRTGAHEIYGTIRARWASLGWEKSFLGYPTRGEYAVPGGRASDFQGGRITWNARTGATTVTRR